MGTTNETAAGARDRLRTLGRYVADADRGWQATLLGLGIALAVATYGP